MYVSDSTDMRSLLMAIAFDDLWEKFTPINTSWIPGSIPSSEQRAIAINGDRQKQSPTAYCLNI